MKGKLVDEIPEPASREKDGMNWDELAELAKANPGKPVEAEDEFPSSRVRALRMRNRPPFIDETGEIVVSHRNTYIREDDGRRWGTVYLTWVPREETQ